MPPETLTVHGIPVQFDFQRPITPANRQVLLTTLGLLPTEHLRRIPTVVVGDRPEAGGGGAVAPWEAGGPLIRINVQRFSEGFNTPHNHTLLHEIGHIMDYSYQCIRAFYRRPEYRPCLNLMRRRAPLHEGRTKGENEIYADTYSGLFRRSQSILRLGWVGTNELYAAVLCSPTFDCCRRQFDSFVGRTEVTFADDDAVTAQARRRR